MKRIQSLDKHLGSWVKHAERLGMTESTLRARVTKAGMTEEEACTYPSGTPASKVLFDRIDREIAERREWEDGVEERLCILEELMAAVRVVRMSPAALLEPEPPEEDEWARRIEAEQEAERVRYEGVPDPDTEWEDEDG